MTRESCIAQMNMLDPSRIRIHRSSRHRVCLEFTDTNERIRGVKLSLLFPLTDRKGFVRVCAEDKKEIGIVRSIDELDADSQSVVLEELGRVYFIPRITRVLSIDEKFDIRTWNVITERGPRVFDVRGRESIRFIAPSHLVVKDVDGNRYEIPSIAELDPVSRHMLEIAV